jgi:hypothetical protein
VAIEDRLRRLEGGSQQLCGGCPYDGPVLWLEHTRVLHDDGSEDFICDPRDTDELSEPCSRCPYTNNPTPPITVVEVVRTVRVGGEL